MAQQINSKFITFANKEQFDKTSDFAIPDRSIVFIADTGEIYCGRKRYLGLVNSTNDGILPCFNSNLQYTNCTPSSDYIAVYNNGPTWRKASNIVTTGDEQIITGKKTFTDLYLSSTKIYSCQTDNDIEVFNVDESRGLIELGKGLLNFEGGQEMWLTSKKIILNTDKGPVMAINNNGHMVIGGKDPSNYKLQVAGGSLIADGVHSWKTGFTIDGLNIGNEYVLLAGGGYKLLSEIIPTISSGLLTDYIKGTSTDSISTEDTVLTALGKLENKADIAYTWLTAAENNDNNIDNLTELLKVVSDLKSSDVQGLLDAYLPLSGGIMTGDISWETDNHGVYFFGGCGIEKRSGYAPTLVGEKNKNFYITNSQNRNDRSIILHAGNTSLSGNGGGNPGDSLQITINNNTKTLTIPSAMPATKLQNSIKIFGQFFDGTTDISDTLSNVSTIYYSENHEIISAGDYLQFGKGFKNKTVWISGGDLKFESGGTTQMVINNKGVGIGNVGGYPAAKLHVGGGSVLANGFIAYQGHLEIQNSDYGVVIKDKTSDDILVADGTTISTSSFIKTSSFNSTNYPGLNKIGTVTEISIGAGLTGSDITTSGTIKASLKSEDKSSLSSANMGNTSSRQYAVGLDKDGYLSVNIPWEKTEIDNWSIVEFEAKYSSGTEIGTITINDAAQTIYIPSISELISNNVTYTGTLTNNRIAVFNGNQGQIKASAYTISKSVPEDAVFTDQFRKIIIKNDNDTIVSLGTDINSGDLILQSGTNIKFGFDEATSSVLINSTYTHPTDGGNTGSFGPATDASPAHGGSFSVPYLTVNSAGHVTEAFTKTITLPANVVSSTEIGLTPAIGTTCNTTIDSQSTNWVLTSTSGNTPTWRKLPENAFRYRTYSAATTSSNGLMTSDMVTKLNDLTNYDLPIASKDALGGFKASNVLTTAVTLTSGNGSTPNRYYGVQVDKDGNAFVNVPWEQANVENGDSVSYTAVQTTGTKLGTITINAANYDIFAPSVTDTYRKICILNSTGSIVKTFESALTSGQINLQSGTNISFTTNEHGTVSISATDTDTKNTAGSTNTSSKIFLIGATSQAANPQTYSRDTAYVGTDGCLYSNNTKVSVEGHGVHIPSGGSSGQFLGWDSSGTAKWVSNPNIWNANALNVAGYVAAPTSNSKNQVWKTDNSGNPAWRNDFSRGLFCLTDNDQRTQSIIPSNLSSSETWTLTLKHKDVTGLTATYSGIMSFRPYGSSSDWTCGPAHQLAFDENGIHHRTNTNNTWDAWTHLTDAMVGATGSKDGSKGLVPAPIAGNQDKFLKGNGTWSTPTTVAQSEKDDDAYRPLLLGFTSSSTPGADMTTSVTDSIYVNNKIYANANKGTIYSNSYEAFQTNGGAVFKIKYNNNTYGTIYNHNNGNVSINAAGGDLYLGNNSTNTIRTKSGHVVLDANNYTNYSHFNIAIPTANKLSSDAPSTYDTGLSIDKIYKNDSDNDWPFLYGNALTIRGTGSTQLALEWNSKQTANDPNVAQSVHIRSQRDSAGDVWSKWTTLLTDNNYSTYTVKKDGTGATGEWDIDINGNANTINGYKIWVGTSTQFADQNIDQNTIYFILNTGI